MTWRTVERPTTRRTLAEQAQFEVPALRWADISDATHGFSLLNDSKYGYDAKDNVLRLSLLLDVRILFFFSFFCFFFDSMVDNLSFRSDGIPWHY